MRQLQTSLQTVINLSTVISSSLQLCPCHTQDLVSICSYRDPKRTTLPFRANSLFCCCSLLWIYNLKVRRWQEQKRFWRWYSLEIKFCNWTSFRTCKFQTSRLYILFSWILSWIACHKYQLIIQTYLKNIRLTKPISHRTRD